VEGSSTPFRFNVLAQLANLPAQITLYKLLRLSKSIRKALREALANSEAFIAQIPALCEKKDDGHCHHTSKLFSMQIKEKHYRPLYHARYIGSS